MELALLGEEQLAATTSAAFLLLIWGIVFVESGLLFGFFLPGDSVLFAAGLLAADPRTDVSIVVLTVGVVVAAVTGDAVGYTIGRRGGRPLLERRQGKLLGPDVLRRAEAFYARWGWWSIVVARWIPWVRTFCPVIAGAARMPYPWFLSANVVGALAWGAGLVLLGYAAASLPGVRNAAVTIGLTIATVTTVLAVARWLRWRRARQGRPGERPPTPPGEPSAGG